MIRIPLDEDGEIAALFDSVFDVGRLGTDTGA